MLGYPVTLEQPVQWGEMDALRHVNNARFFTWFESARITYFDRLRASIPGAGTTVGLGDIGPILASTSCDFLRPITYPAVVRIGARVTELGNSSMRMEYAVARTDAPEDMCAKGTSVIVLVRYSTLQKVRVPDEMRAAIDALEKRST
ncbi:4-hydroxybenzoyl-CoA thioesterase [Minicystis rosea]|nr:4-hydroxybenzoyl-CoA thioesterase [Minicystis rosea]